MPPMIFIRRAMARSAAVLAALLLGACASLPHSDGPAISRSETLTLSADDYALALRVKTQDELFSLDANEANRRDMAMNLHSTSDLEAQAEAAGLDRDPAVVATLAELRRRVLTTKLMEQVGQAVVAPDEATLDTLGRERYERDKAKLVTPERRQIAHILLTEINGCPCKLKPALERSKDLWYALNRGGDFAAAAREQSQDVGSAQKGGDLGWVTRDGQLVRAFEDAAFELKEVGDISVPIKTSYGLHIIKLLGLERPRQLSYEETEAQLKKQIVNDLRFSALQTRRGLAYPDPDTVDVAEIGRLVKARMAELGIDASLPAEAPKGRFLERPIPEPAAEPAVQPAATEP